MEAVLRDGDVAAVPAMLIMLAILRRFPPRDSGAGQF